MSCCKSRIIQATSGGGGGPYIVQNNTPIQGDVTVTDSAGDSFVIPDNKEESYLQNIVVSDWIAGAGTSTLSIPVANHNRGTNPTVSTYEGTQLVMVDSLDISATGDIILTVINGSEFDGKVIVTR